MAMPVTVEDFIKDVMQMLDDSVAHLPEEERNEAQCNIINALSAQMFYGGKHHHDEPTE